VTSTRCADLVGESQANCSFQLRQLAKYGLVEEAPTSSKKERPFLGALGLAAAPWQSGDAAALLPSTSQPTGRRCAQCRLAP
jgi:hypothetical protein